MSRDPVVQLDRHYRDKRGVVVHVIAYDRIKQEVTFMRPDYEHECMLPLWQVEKHFTRVDSDE
ncbi:DUF4222 domain-containing protein [Serratia proteamaculans]|uniref:DUF4222 domain-containing protein n=1 Tax=Serratia proteamaculans TaxID=28151 RepID=UPI00217C9D89|nr:DUF4222 domain-containing protein [Serratia proteamaculans]CAI0986164.1 Uncharacterised protein [Serratia proteamaculans]